ncbi:MAG: ABC transporter ATP-binding protein [Deltaproteobacteria bacterium]
MLQDVARLWRLLTPRRRGQFLLVVVVMVVASLSEMVSIGTVVPFLGVLASPERWFAMPALRPLIDLLGIHSPSGLVLPLTALFCAAAVLADATRFLLVWATTRVTYGAGADLSIDIYRRTLYQPYSVHVARNSSEVISGIVSKTSTVVSGAYLPLATFLGSALLIVSIVGTLMAIDFVTAVSAFVGFGLLYALFSGVTQRRLVRNGELIAARQTEVMKSLQEGLGGIRDVLIDGSQQVYCEAYQRADLSMRGAEASNSFIGWGPKFAMEALGMVLIAALAWTFRGSPGGLASAIPVLGAIALGAQRLMPALQQGYLSWTAMLGSQASLRETLRLLDQPLPDHAGRPNPPPIPFEREIELRDVGFRYTPGGPWVFRHLDLHIPRGSRVGFKGTTGSGKSTLIDLVMGLLDPTEGDLLVDGQPIGNANRRAWQVRIAHVPQSIFLADTTIAENIAFGLPRDQVDMDRVREAARRAHIADDIESWPSGYSTRVGERGVRLSGGQRQRIGIARALYKKASVIIFDEATSALDSDTEESVMRSIAGLGPDLTLLIVAHRLSTLQGCDRIVEVA